MFITVCCLIFALCMPAAAFADSVTGPVEVQWSNLHIDPTGLLSWTMTTSEEDRDLQVRYYTVYMDIMANGIWRENYRKFNSPESSIEINYGLVGIYKFHVGATFIGGLVSTLSEDSDWCTVTEDYVHKEVPTGGSTGPGGSTNPGSSIGPGSSTGSGSSIGPGSSTGTGSTSYNDVPAWAEKTGSWIQSGGNWYYQNNGVIYKNKWACIYNPYAKTGLGQRAYDWFNFDENGIMRTGWYTDPTTGYVFYLNPNADGTRGKMVTGWQLIDGYYYYFSEAEGSGYMGALATNTTIDGRRVDAQGRWVQ